MKALILAAGYATRLYPLTQDKPKALLPIADKPIINYIVDEIANLPEVDEIIVVSNHRFIQHFNDWKTEVENNYTQKITVVDDNTTSDDDKLGAIGDIQFVIDTLNIDDEMLIIAGDNLFTYSLLDIYNHYKEHGEDMILVKPHDDAEDLKRFAVALIDENNIVTELEEKPQEPKSDLAVYATYFYQRETLPLIKTYLEDGNNPDSPGNFPAWLYKKKPVRACVFDGEAFDIGTHDSYNEVDAYIRKLQKN